MNPREIDNKIAALQEKRTRANSKRKSALLSARNLYGGHKAGYQEIMDALLDNQDQSSAKRYLGIIDTEEREALEAEKQIEALNAEYAEDPWSRFYLVSGNNGHIHSSTECSTCHRGRQRTRFAWLTDLSGKTEEEAVESQGAILCSVCFPSAPVEWTNYWELKAQKSSEDACPGSGTTEHTNMWRNRRYATCDHCAKSVSLVSGGKMRKHKA